jgi:hypothetical protein
MRFPAFALLIAAGPAALAEHPSIAYFRGQLAEIAAEARHACGSQAPGDARAALAEQALARASRLVERYRQEVRRVHRELEFPRAVAGEEGRRIASQRRERVRAAALLLEALNRSPAFIQDAQRARVREEKLRWDAAERSRAQLSSDAFALDPEAQALATQRSRLARRELDELAPLAVELDSLEARLRGCWTIAAQAGTPSLAGAAEPEAVRSQPGEGRDRGSVPD